MKRKIYLKDMAMLDPDIRVNTLDDIKNLDGVSQLRTNNLDKKGYVEVKLDDEVFEVEDQILDFLGVERIA